MIQLKCRFLQDFAARITSNVNKEIKHETVNNKSNDVEVSDLKRNDNLKAEGNNKDENKISNIKPVVQNIKENEDKNSDVSNRRDYVTDDQFFDDFFSDEDE